MLDKQYHIVCDRISEAEAGWSALAYKIRSGEKYYFLKVYDRHQYSAQSWIDRIDDYMPVLLWLEAKSGLRDSVPSVVLSFGGDYQYRDDDFIYILFDYIDGENLFGVTLSHDLIKELAEIVAKLHCIDYLPVSTERLIETFDLSLVTGLYEILRSKQQPMDLKQILELHADIIVDKLKVYACLAESLRSNPPEFVLCHTDIHCWNIMQDSRLKLIDWEGVRLAPAEADLFSFTEGFFFGNVWDEFLAAYQTFHPDYQVNSEALRYYRLRRLLEDISSFSEGLLYDDLAPEDRALSLDLLRNSCLSLSDV